MATAIKTNEILVLDVYWRGVKIAINGENRVTPWADLKAAASQDDARLREVYGGILREARRLAGLKKALAVTICNRTNTPHGYEACLYDMADEFVSGRIVAADFGLTGSRAHAERDAAEARRKLAAMGYDVT